MESNEETKPLTKEKASMIKSNIQKIYVPSVNQLISRSKALESKKESAKKFINSIATAKKGLRHPRVRKFFFDGYHSVTS